MKLTSLSENSVSAPGCVGEWGWSVHIDADAKNILFDTGAGFAALKNAEKLGIDLGSLDTIILSHAHDDHTGGLQDVLCKADHPEILAHPDVWKPKYAKKREDGSLIYNGIPFDKEELEKLASFRLSEKPIQISENILTSGEIPQTTDFEIVEPSFFTKGENSVFSPDNFPDDLALIIKSEKGLVVILGCAHRGIINTLLHAQNITGETTIHMVIGGSHLYPKSGEVTKKTIAALKEINVQHIGVSHCTGMKASIQLREAFGERFFFNNAGDTINV